MLLYGSTFAWFEIVDSVLKYRLCPHAKIYQIQSILLRIEPKLRIEAPMKCGFRSILTCSVFGQKYSLKSSLIKCKMVGDWLLMEKCYLEVMAHPCCTRLTLKHWKVSFAYDPSSIVAYFVYNCVCMYCASVCFWFPLCFFFLWWFL